LKNEEEKKLKEKSDLKEDQDRAKKTRN